MVERPLLTKKSITSILDHMKGQTSELVSTALEPASTRTRRKEARPGEIIEAATLVFGEKGYAAARLEEVARRAGVSKGTVYVYFETKEALFRAVARSAMASRLTPKASPSPIFEGSVTRALPEFIARFLGTSTDDRAHFLVRMVITEAHNFPDLARIWYDEVVLPIADLVANLIADAQSRGEVRAGDPRLIAFSVLGPLQMALLHKATFARIEKFEPDIEALGEQHLQILLHGLLTPYFGKAQTNECNPSD